MNRRVTLLALMCLLFAASVMTQAASNSEGRHFMLYGSAADASDPQNPANDVVAVDTTAGHFGGVMRPLGFGVKAGMLTNQLSFKYYFVDRSCGGSSPRMAILVDTDGDGKTDDEALGYIGTGCPTGQWVFVDMTDTQPRWDLHFFGGPAAVTWAGLVTFFSTNYPKHQVLAGALDDDGGLITGTPVVPGHAVYDLVTIGNLTLDGGQDTRPLNF